MLELTDSLSLASPDKDACLVTVINKRKSVHVVAQVEVGEVGLLVLLLPLHQPAIVGGGCVRSRGSYQGTSLSCFQTCVTCLTMFGMVGMVSKEVKILKPANN